MARHIAPSGTEEHDRTGDIFNESANSSNNSATYFTLHNKKTLPRNRAGPGFRSNDPGTEVTSAPSSICVDVNARDHNVPYCPRNENSVQNRHGSEQNVSNQHTNDHIESSRHGNKQTVHHRRHGNQRRHSNLSDVDLRQFDYTRETGQGETGHISTYHRSSSVENVAGHQGTLVANRNGHGRQLYRNCPVQEIPNSNHTIGAQHVLQMNDMRFTAGDILR